MQDLSTIVLRNENGQEQLYQVLFVFTNELTNKNYIVYTDRNFTTNGELNVFANSYDGDLDDLTLYPIETQQEWQDVESVLNLLEEDGQLSGKSRPSQFIRTSSTEVDAYLPIYKENSLREYTILARFTNPETHASYVIVKPGINLKDGVQVGRITEYDIDQQPAQFVNILNPDEWSSIHDTVSEILSEFGRQDSI